MLVTFGFWPSFMPILLDGLWTSTMLFLATQVYGYALQSNHSLKSKLLAFLKRHDREDKLI